MNTYTATRFLWVRSGKVDSQNLVRLNLFARIYCPCPKHASVKETNGQFLLAGPQGQSVER